MGSGGEAEDEDAGLGVAEAGNRFRPIFPIDVGATLFAANGFTIFRKPSTESAGNNFAVEYGEG